MQLPHSALHNARKLRLVLQAATGVNVKACAAVDCQLGLKPNSKGEVQAAVA
jgi:hypothetical protein